MFLDEETSDRLKNMKNGIVYIIITTKDRHGNEDDIREIQEVFENYYNSKVYVWQDLKLSELRQKFVKVKKSESWNETYKNAEFLICFALTATAGDGRFGLCNGHVIDAVQGILKQFVKAPELRLKPRWLILQSRRGLNQHYHLNVIIEGHNRKVYPTLKDQNNEEVRKREQREVMRYTDYHYVTEENEVKVHHMKKFCEEIKKLKL